MAPKFAENRQNYLYFSNDGIDTETVHISHDSGKLLNLL